MSLNEQTQDGNSPAADMQNSKHCAAPRTASDFIHHADLTLAQRGKQYDVGGKQERSMAKIVAAFNAVHDADGAQLTEQQGWAFMLLLKLVRGAHAPHLDSALDAVGYSALYGECVAEQLAAQEAQLSPLQWSMAQVEKAAMFGNEPVLTAYKEMNKLSAEDTHMRNRVAELEAMLKESLNKQAIIENRNDNLVAQLAEANAGYERLQAKLRKMEEALHTVSDARQEEIERNKQLMIRNDELHSDVSQAMKELADIRTECAARGEELERVRHRHEESSLGSYAPHVVMLCVRYTR